MFCSVASPSARSTIESNWRSPLQACAACGPTCRGAVSSAQSAARAQVLHCMAHLIFPFAQLAPMHSQQRAYEAGSAQHPWAFEQSLSETASMPPVHDGCSGASALHPFRMFAILSRATSFFFRSSFTTQSSIICFRSPVELLVRLQRQFSVAMTSVQLLLFHSDTTVRARLRLNCHVSEGKPSPQGHR